MKAGLIFITILFCICCVGLYFQRQTINNQNITFRRLDEKISAEKQMAKGCYALIANLRNETNRLAKELAGEKKLVSSSRSPDSRPHPSGLSDEQIEQILGPAPTTRYIPAEQNLAQVVHNAEVLTELRRTREAQEQQNWNQQFWNLDRSLNSESDSFERMRQTRALEGIEDALQQQNLQNLIHHR